VVVVGVIGRPAEQDDVALSGVLGHARLDNGERASAEIGEGASATGVAHVGHLLSGPRARAVSKRPGVVERVPTEVPPNRTTAWCYRHF
jgi:hypothetical protein